MTGSESVLICLIVLFLVLAVLGLSLPKGRVQIQVWAFTFFFAILAALDFLIFVDAEGGQVVAMIMGGLAIIGLILSLITLRLGTLRSRRQTNP